MSPLGLLNDGRTAAVFGMEQAISHVIEGRVNSPQVLKFEHPWSASAALEKYSRSGLFGICAVGDDGLEWSGDVRRGALRGTLLHCRPVPS